MKKLTTFAMAAAIASGMAFGATTAFADGHSGPKTGTFVGKTKHVTTGGASVVKTVAGAHVVILDKDFDLDGAPDPRVGFGKDGKYDHSTDLGKLGSIKGLQAFAVRASIDVAKYNEVYIWCRKFNVPLGVAKLN